MRDGKDEKSAMGVKAKKSAKRKWVYTPVTNPCGGTYHEGKEPRTAQWRHPITETWLCHECVAHLLTRVWDRLPSA